MFNIGSVVSTITFEKAMNKTDHHTVNHNDN